MQGVQSLHVSCGEAGFGELAFRPIKENGASRKLFCTHRAPHPSVSGSSYAAGKTKGWCSPRSDSLVLANLQSCSGDGFVLKTAFGLDRGVGSGMRKLSGWKKSTYTNTIRSFSRSPPAVETSSETLRTLYPSTTSHKQGYVKVSELHTIYYEIFGNPKGRPAVFLHGGPGAGCTANHSRFFDPEHYRIILFDQRACGKSTPRGCLEENNTWELVEDLEKLRKELNVQKWLVVGGSWGTTLALAYAQTHPECVSAMVLRAVCMMRKREIDWFYKQGADALFPFAWADYVAHIPEAERADLLQAYYQRLTSADRQVADAAARSWIRWEMSLLSFSNVPVVIAWDGKEYKTLPMPVATASPTSGPAPNPASSTPTSSTPISSEVSGGVTTQASDTSGSADTVVKAEVKTGVTKAGEGSTSKDEGEAETRPELKGASTEASSSSNNGSNHRDNGATPSNAGRASAGGMGEAGQGNKSEGVSAKSEEKVESKTEPETITGTETQTGTTAGVKTEAETGNGHTGGHQPSAENMRGGQGMSSTLAQARLESHYSVNGAFLSEDQLLRGVDRIRSIPTVAVQGRYDFVCPLKTAYDLHSAWPEMKLRVVPNAGHSQYEPGITHEIIVATDNFRSLDY